MKLRIITLLALTALFFGCAVDREMTPSDEATSCALTPFDQWLLTYTPPPPGTLITRTDANKCLQVCVGAKPIEVKAAAVWQLGYYWDWSGDQITRLANSVRTMDESTQWDVMSLMSTMFTDDFNAPTADAYCKGWLTLMRTMKNIDDRSSAADSACYYANPGLMQHALSSFGGNTDPDYEVNGIAPYFAYYYYDSLVSSYVEEEPANTLKHRWSEWWRIPANKHNWLMENSDYVSAPRKYVKNGDIYAYIFTVSDYPAKWGDIDLPGANKDADTMAALFKAMPKTKSVKVYKDAAANYANFHAAWNEIIAKDSNELCFVFFSGHGATSASGTKWYILLHDFDINYASGEFINTPGGRELQDLMYASKYMKNNKLTFFLSDSCLAGGLVNAQAVKGRIKSYRPKAWGEVTLLPTVYSDLSFKNLGNYMLACRGNQYSYDTPTGGAFTLALSKIWGDKKFKMPFGVMMNKTGRSLLKDGFGMTPQLVVPKGNEKLTIFK